MRSWSTAPGRTSAWSGSRGVTRTYWAAAGEEVQACRAAGVEVEVVPGVTSAVAVPAAVGIPVTHRTLSRGFSVLTAHDELHQAPSAADHTLVLLMGVAGLARACRQLVAAGRPAETPVAIVEDGFRSPATGHARHAGHDRRPGQGARRTPARRRRRRAGRRAGRPGVGGSPAGVTTPRLACAGWTSGPCCSITARRTSCSCPCAASPTPHGGRRSPMPIARRLGAGAGRRQHIGTGGGKPRAVRLAPSDQPRCGRARTANDRLAAAHDRRHRCRRPPLHRGRRGGAGSCSNSSRKISCGPPWPATAARSAASPMRCPPTTPSCRSRRGCCDRPPPGSSSGSCGWLPPGVMSSTRRQ